MAEEQLFKLGKPAIYIMVMNASDFANLYLSLQERHQGCVIRMIRGSKCRTVSSFFDEIAAALQFPYYFGENWGAFEEMIVDLDWLDGDAYLLLVSDGSLLLADADTEDFRILMQRLASANVEWLTPNEYMPRTRQPTPFHVLLQCSESDLPALSERLTQQGSEFELLDLTPPPTSG
jgi:hypothetical protein